MMSPGPVFFLQIVDKDGQVAHLPGGGPLEVNLIDLVTKMILTKGVGLLKTQSQVESAIRAGFNEVLTGLKNQTISLV